MYFIFNNIESNNYPELIVTSLPAIRKPAVRYSKTEIDGRDGDIIELEGYEAYDKTIEIGLTNTNNIDNIIAWLYGSGDLIMSNEDDKVYKAQVLKEIDFERLVKFRTAEIVFHVQPYKYLLNEATITATSSQRSAKSMTINNQGNVACKPVIKLTGSGTVNVSLNGSSIFSYTFPSGDSYVYIDSEEQEAYVSSILKNRNMNGDFPVLNPGNNTLSWTGTLSAVEIERRSRWL